MVRYEDLSDEQKRELRRLHHALENQRKLREVRGADAEPIGTRVVYEDDDWVEEVDLGSPMDN